jgi:hypothetical protein
MQNYNSNTTEGDGGCGQEKFKTEKQTRPLVDLDVDGRIIYAS